MSSEYLTVDEEERHKREAGGEEQSKRGREKTRESIAQGSMESEKLEGGKRLIWRK